MHKRSIIFLIVVVVLVAAALICMIPRFKVVDATLLATKITHRGEVLGAYEIVLNGTRQDYLFGNPVLELSVAPFDILRDFVAESEIRIAAGGEICYALYSVVNTETNNVDVLRICFSPDMDRWLILNDMSLICYVSSVSGDYSAEQLMEYFDPVIPNNG